MIAWAKRLGSIAVVGALASCSSQSLAAELEWHAPAGCPDSDAVERRVVDALGMPLERAAPLRCIALVDQRDNGSWHLTLEIRTKAETGPAHARSIDAVSCDKLADAAAVALSLALGEAAQLRESPNDAVSEPGASEPATPTAATATSQPKSKPLDERSSVSLWSWHAGLGALLDGGSLPQVAPGAEAFGALRHPNIGVRITALFLPERRSSASGAGGEFSLFAGSLALCGYSRASVGAMACAGSELGLLRGVGVNVSAPQRGQSLWVAPRLDLGWAWNLADELALVVDAGVVMPLVRKQFVLDHVGAMHRPNSLAWRLGIGLQLTWR